MRERADTKAATASEGRTEALHITTKPKPSTINVNKDYIAVAKAYPTPTGQQVWFCYPYCVVEK